MNQHKRTIPINKMVVLVLVFLNAIIAKTALIRNENWYWALMLKIHLTITNEYYETINANIKGQKSINSLDRSNATLLREELKKATLVKKNELPADVVRLNSRVKIKEVRTDKLIELILVLPEKAN